VRAPRAASKSVLEGQDAAAASEACKGRRRPGGICAGGMHRTLQLAGDRPGDLHAALHLFGHAGPPTAPLVIGFSGRPVGIVGLPLPLRPNGTLVVEDPVTGVPLTRRAGTAPAGGMSARSSKASIPAARWRG